MSPTFNNANLNRYECLTLPSISLPAPGIIRSNPLDISQTIVDNMLGQTPTGPLQQFLIQ